MAFFPKSIPYDLSSGLKESYVPQYLLDLINELRQHSCGDEFRLSVLDSYLRKCQMELLGAGVLEHEHSESECRSMTLKGIEALKREIARINKDIELNTSVRLPIDFSGSNNCLRLKKQGLDLNKPDIGHEQRQSNFTHRQDTRRATKLHISQSSGFFHNPPSSIREDPDDVYLQARERTMMNFLMRPLTEPIWKNNRRAWTKELHARFVAVLQILGGPKVATPKRIRDHMQVDGLTIDQVKSHLQKFRSNLRASHVEVPAKKPEKLWSRSGYKAATCGASHVEVPAGYKAATRGASHVEVPAKEPEKLWSRSGYKAATRGASHVEVPAKEPEKLWSRSGYKAATSGASHVEVPAKEPEKLWSRSGYKAATSGASHVEVPAKEPEKLWSRSGYKAATSGASHVEVPAKEPEKLWSRSGYKATTRGASHVEVPAKEPEKLWSRSGYKAATREASHVEVPAKKPEKLWSRSGYKAATRGACNDITTGNLL